MNDSRMMEVMIAADDHRLLSANAEAWWLVQNDVFVPLESFLTEESSAEFLQRLNEKNAEWFLTRFKTTPALPYLTRIAAESFEQEGGNMIRVILCRLHELMDNYSRLNDALATHDAMLSIYEDLYFEYSPAEKTVTLYNANQSAYSNGVMEAKAFFAALSARCNEESQSALNSVISHLRDGAPRFRQSIPCNLFKDDSAVQSVQIKWLTIHLHKNQTTIVGLIHPLRSRGTEESAVTYDPLTGTISKEFITRMAEDRINQQHAEHTALAILDIDYFKHANDNYGHQYGDQLLRQVASIMETEIKDGGAVGRIGGDEFMMLFYHVENETALRAYLRSIKSVVSAVLPGVTVSIGAAVYPDAAPNYSDLFLVADYCLYLAKAKGRNRYIIHTLAKHPPLAEIKAEQSGGERNLVRGRDDLPLGDALVQLMYMMQYGKKPPLSTVVEEFAVRAALPLLSLWREKDRALLAVGGKEKHDVDALQAFVSGHDLSELEIPRYLIDGMTVTHTVDKKEEGCVELREALLEHQILSFIYIPFTDAAGEKASLVLASVNRKVFWNEEHLKYYRLFADMLSRCTLSEFSPA